MSRTKEHPLTKCLHSYQNETHTQLTNITAQALDILKHIATLGNNSCHSQEGTLENKDKEQNKTKEESEGEISFGEELNEIFESNSETGEHERKLNAEQDSCDIQTSEVDVYLSEEKEVEYKKILENVVKDVQSSLGTLYPSAPKISSKHTKKPTTVLLE